ncbi:Metallo-hydrolase/oxidoreductase [Panus rudis PR-1116 ss-1]|nr:Metallo-hydrolase/oxidoreductase [Panus rudis PR-1116 ss-1]
MQLVPTYLFTVFSKWFYNRMIDQAVCVIPAHFDDRNENITVHGRSIRSWFQLSKNVIRILGQNPGKFTLQGTNTYLVGTRNPYVLIDTGEGKDEYIPLLQNELENRRKVTDAVDISDIIITHRHGDHCGGLPSVLSLLGKLWSNRKGSSAGFTPPRIHKIPLTASDDKLKSVVDSLPPSSYTPTPSGSPLHDLKDGQHLPVVSDGDASESLQILHTPGHTQDSLCLYFAPDNALFTADTVLGQGTAVFEDLGEYMRSLQKILDFNKDPAHQYTLVYPGHGPVVEDGPQHVGMYYKHRLDRETQIVAVLVSDTNATSQGGEKSLTTWDIVGTLYKNYPENLWEAAAHSVNLHLRKLEEDGKVKLVEGAGKDSRWVVLH